MVHRVLVHYKVVHRCSVAGETQNFAVVLVVLGLNYRKARGRRCIVAWTLLEEVHCRLGKTVRQRTRENLHPLEDPPGIAAALGTRSEDPNRNRRRPPQNPGVPDRVADPSRARQGPPG